MLFAELCRVSEQVKGTRSRTAKTDLLAALLRQLAADEVSIGVAYLSGVLPQGRLGVGYSSLHGSDVPPAGNASLTLLEVDARLATLKATTGKGSTTARKQLLGALFARGTRVEHEFLKPLLYGELRQGALEGVMVDAVAKAFGAEVSAVRRAWMISGDMAAVADAMARRGPGALSEFALQLFRPLGPMLAQPGEDLSAAVTATSENGSTRLEHKLDGARIQVHRLDDEIRVYTRELHDISDRVPEIVQVARALRSTQFVLDGEALALKADGRPYPFQDTMRRIGRKKADESVRAKLPLSPFFFDVLHVEGKDLLDESLAVRRAELENFVPAHALVEQTSVQDEAEARAFLERALSQGHEGVMAKDPGSTYEAGRRGGAWLKIKPAHTLDLVVLAAEWGSGRRKGFLSNIHLGARGPGGTFVMLGKTFKGMTDAMLAFQTEQFQKLSLGQEGSVVHVRPELVVEVAFDGIQKSVQYPGGLALRFARVKRYRTEKNASQADTIETVRALYQANH